VTEIRIDRERCKGCGLCLSVCPKGLLEAEEGRNARGHRPVRAVEGAAARCVRCGRCYRVCPDVAIEIVADDASDAPAGEEEA
jgi:2-oxoglutarate ferredoxin oxidoreductase subunit delta